MEPFCLRQGHYVEARSDHRSACKISAHCCISDTPKTRLGWRRFRKPARKIPVLDMPSWGGTVGGGIDVLCAELDGRQVEQAFWGLGISTLVA